MSNHDKSNTERNKAYIDVFMTKHYQKIHDRLRPFDCKLNSRGCSALDILHDVILSVYNDPDLMLCSQSQADAYLSIRFNLKIRNNRLR